MRMARQTGQEQARSIKGRQPKKQCWMTRRRTLSNLECVQGWNLNTTSSILVQVHDIDLMTVKEDTALLHCADHSNWPEHKLAVATKNAIHRPELTKLAQMMLVTSVFMLSHCGLNCANCFSVKIFRSFNVAASMDSTTNLGLALLLNLSAIAHAGMWETLGFMEPFQRSSFGWLFLFSRSPRVPSIPSLFVNVTPGSF